MGAKDCFHVDKSCVTDNVVIFYRVMVGLLRYEWHRACFSCGGRNLSAHAMEF